MLVLILDILYPLLCVILPCAVYQVFAVKKLENKKYLARHMVWAYIFLIYIFLVMQVTGVGTVWDIGKFGSIIRFDEIQLIPFKNGIGVESVLNSIMFMPLGFLLPLIWRRCRNVFNIMLIGACFSLAIELGQLFNRRFTDINDLIMNTLGAVFGYVIWVLFKKIFKKSGEKTAELLGNEAIIYLFLSYFGNFLLFNWRWMVKLFVAIS